MTAESVRFFVARRELTEGDYALTLPRLGDAERAAARGRRGRAGVNEGAALGDDRASLGVAADELDGGRGGRVAEVRLVGREVADFDGARGRRRVCAVAGRVGDGVRSGRVRVNRRQPARPGDVVGQGERVGRAISQGGVIQDRPGAEAAGRELEGSGVDRRPARVGVRAEQGQRPECDFGYRTAPANGGGKRPKRRLVEDKAGVVHDRAGSERSGAAT